MSKAIHVIPEPLPTTSETRFAAYLLTEYLERLGVDVVFGLTGHTVIGLLDALGRAGSATSAPATSRSRRMRPTVTRARPASRACC